MQAIENKKGGKQCEENKKDQNKNNEVKSVVIIGDSMIKHLNGWDMSEKVHKSECKIYVKSFPGVKTSCMKNYVKPSLRSTPNHFILHVGTNDLTSNQTSDVIAKEIVAAIFIDFPSKFVIVCVRLIFVKVEVNGFIGLRR